MGRTDTVPGGFDPGWLDQHADETNKAVKQLESWYRDTSQTDNDLKDMLVSLRQKTETLAFAGRQWNGGKVGAGHDGQAGAISLAGSMGLAAGQAIDVIVEAQKFIATLDTTDSSDKVSFDLEHAQQVLADSRGHCDKLINMIRSGEACEQP